jgi:hypothetical protein
MAGNELAQFNLGCSRMILELLNSYETLYDCCICWALRGEGMNTSIDGCR